MKMNLKFIVYYLFSMALTVLVAQQSFGQGCSDAGACSIGSMDEISDEIKPPKFKFSIDQNVALG